MSRTLRALLVVGALLVVARVALAAAADVTSRLALKTEEAARTARASRNVAPIAGAAVAVHDPFGTEECMQCHASDDKQAPGPVVGTTNALCLKCHDDPGLQGTTPFLHQHGGKNARCLDCHNPHNSAQEHLLHEPIQQL